MHLTRTRLLGMTGLLALIAVAVFLIRSPDSGNSTLIADADTAARDSQDSRNPLLRNDGGNENLQQRIVRVNRREAATDSATTGDSDDAVNNAASRNGTGSATVPIPDSPTPSSPILSERVYKVIDEVQKRFTDQQIEEGLNELNALYEDYDQLNDFEKATVLNFYSNALLAYRMLPEATAVFEKLLTVDNLRDDIRERALRSLGQLNMAQEHYDQAINYFNQFLAVSASRDTNALLGLANAHYAMQQYDQAIPLLVEHIQGLLTEGKDVEKSKIGLLATMAAQTQDGELLAMVKEFLASQTTPAPN